MTVTVYYTTGNNIFTDAFPSRFDNLLGHLTNKDTDCVVNARTLGNYIQCPAFIQSIKNTYIFRSSVDYSIGWNKNKNYIYSTAGGQKEFDRLIIVRDGTNGCFSFLQQCPMFISEAPLLFEQTNAYFHDNDFTKKVIFCRGEYDIGKHYRAVEVAGYLRNEELVDIRKNDVLCYFKFFTEEKIKFVRFWTTPEFSQLVNAQHNLKTHKRIIPLNLWYENNAKFYRKKLLSLVKKNLAE